MRVLGEVSGFAFGWPGAEVQGTIQPDADERRNVGWPPGRTVANQFSGASRSFARASAHDGGFQYRLQLSQLRYLTTWRAAATSLAENYVGLESV